MTNMMTAILVLRLSAASQVLLLVTALAISPNPLRTRLLGVAIGAIFIVWRGWEDDVVESRLKLRRVFAAGIGVTVAVVVMTEVVLGSQVPKVVEMIGMAAFLG